MSIFREHKTSADRSAQDRRRHREKIEKAIKEGIHNIIADESIIGKDGKTRFKVPVKGIKEYRFVYGTNGAKGTGSSPDKERSEGEVLGRVPKSAGGSGKGEAGNEAGAEEYEIEVSLDDLAAYLFDDLNLPDLEKKRFKNAMSEKLKRKGHRNQGIRPRLDKKETLKQKIRRQAIARSEDEDAEVTLDESDLRFRHIEIKKSENTNAVIFFIMDVSGSMSDEKKFLARSFYFLLYQFIRSRYDSVEIVFIAHTTDAKEVDEKEFFTRKSSGGTAISPALQRVNEIIEERYHPDTWNVYAFHCTDGDNWPDDIEPSLEEARKLKDRCQLYGYCEIVPTSELPRFTKIQESVMLQNFKTLVDRKFMCVKIGDKQDVWLAFKKMFGAKLT
jgi:uncharacterized protein